MAQTIVVSDTSVLLAFAWIGQLDILSTLFGQICIPVAVDVELHRNLHIVGIDSVKLEDWLQIVPVQNQLGVKLLQAHLDLGESQAIVLAHELRASLLLMDERRGRRRAMQSGLNVLGTLGILLRAKESTLIAQVHPLLGRLRQLPFHISDTLYSEILHRAGEAR